MESEIKIEREMENAIVSFEYGTTPLDIEDKAEKTLTVTAGIFIGLILSKIVS